VLVLGLARPAAAVILDDTNRISITLGDGTHVTLIGEATSTPGLKSNNYYYLPTNLRLAQRVDGTPEFLFLKFTTEKAASDGGISGGLLHFLMEWGLTPQQETELKGRLQKDFKNAQLMGAVPLEDGGAGGGSFQIVSGTLSDKTFTGSVVTSGKAPLVPGGRAAAAARLSAEGAQLMAATFEKARSITDLSIALDYSYQTLAPAAKGTITFDWSRLEREIKSLQAAYSQRQTGSRHSESCFLFVCASSDAPTYSYSYDEARRQFDFLIERQVVTLQFDEQIADERVAKIRDAFFQYFLNSLAQPAKDDPPPAPSAQEKEQSPDIRHGNNYRFSQSSFKSMFQRKVQTFRLDYRLAIKWPYQLVGNMASWYHGVADNPSCVASVNLNDPFFQHRDIHFILDLDAKEMFDQAVNYVTVNVRKNRSDGRAFEDRATIDAKYVREKGIDATVTYARGEDQDPDAYEYQVQWSLRGGRLYPASPAWAKGSWEGVTLAPPVVPRKIDVEGDLDAMKASGITRVTVQIHYPKFGDEIEENIDISPVKNEPLVSKTLFMDRDARGYVYRLVVNHKTEGKLVLPWSAKVGDDYVYAAIPPDLLQDNSPLEEQAKEAAKTSADSAKEKVLDQFRDLLGGKGR
jgi:hypothetical protein